MSTEAPAGSIIPPGNLPHGHDGRGEDAEMAARRDLGAAEAEIKKAENETDPERAVADVDAAERDLDQAKEEFKEAEEHRPRLVEVTVDRVVKHVEAGDYVVSAFKQVVGVAADRELDQIKAGVLDPLADTATITIHGHEVFVSHARTGGSS
jgi:hypothetical protein